MKIRIEIKQVNLETHVAEIDLSDPHDKDRFGADFDLYGNLVPDAESDPDFIWGLRQDRDLEFVGVENQSEYVWDCKVLPESEAA
jgi:hypothetical protein